MVCAALLAVFRDAFANRLPMLSALTTLTHPQEDLPGKKTASNPYQHTETQAKANPLQIEQLKSKSHLLKTPIKTSFHLKDLQFFLLFHFF